MKELNNILNDMLGEKMNSEQKRFLNKLRIKVKKKELTVKEAKDIWNKKYKVWREQK